ncbi:MAG TPA: hypothetical protein PKZ32_16450 [Candidatus Melainabacteria bacterium]|nr:hypothetical protein [Candidatus Melainabacteria bacterium]
MADAIENLPVVQEQAKDVSTSLSNLSFDTMLQSFSPKPTTTEQPGDCISFNSIFPEKGLTPEIQKYTSEKIAFSLASKGGEYCRLQSEVEAADQALANQPKLEIRISIADEALARANDVLRITGDKLRSSAAEKFTKQDWEQLKALGPNPFDDLKFKKGPIEFNPAQRAWLRENHPALYRQLENNDASRLARQRAAHDSDALHAIKDGPVNARLELVNYLNKIGDDEAAIANLTEIARSTRTKEQEQAFRAAAQRTDAAWDPAFRKAIEARGGNILDYVSRPPRSIKKDLLNLIPKPVK